MSSYFAPSHSVATPVATVTGINAKITGSTTLYTVPMGSNGFITTGVMVTCDSATAITDGPTIGIENSIGSNNIFAPASLHVLTTANSVFGFSSEGITLFTPPGGTIYLNINSPATGTSESISGALMGYLK